MLARDGAGLFVIDDVIIDLTITVIVFAVAGLVVSGAAPAFALAPFVVATAGLDARGADPFAGELAILGGASNDAAVALLGLSRLTVAAIAIVDLAIAVIVSAIAWAVAFGAGADPALALVPLACAVTRLGAFFAGAFADGTCGAIIALAGGTWGAVGRGWQTKAHRSVALFTKIADAIEVVLAFAAARLLITESAVEAVAVGFALPAADIASGWYQTGSGRSKRQ